MKWKQNKQQQRPHRSQQSLYGCQESGLGLQSVRHRDHSTWSVGHARGIANTAATALTSTAPTVIAGFLAAQHISGTIQGTSIGTITKYACTRGLHCIHKQSAFFVTLCSWRILDASIDIECTEDKMSLRRSNQSAD